MAMAISWPGSTPPPSTAAPGEGGGGEAPGERAWQAPVVSLPKGGGAIRGVGETFEVAPHTGTASASVPIPCSPGRSGHGPQLMLSYDSGTGNGPFGLGWNLGVPAITRRTDRGVPRYLQRSGADDVFVLAGSEDLVPELELVDGEWEQRQTTRPLPGGGPELWEVTRYRPRTEGQFARIERWQSASSGEARWRTITRHNETSWYGTTDESRIFDPAEPNRVASWLACESFDDRGNALLYRYKPEDGIGLDAGRPSERNRAAPANRYLKRILYGNPTPRLPDEDLRHRTDWLFEVVLDYGEHQGTEPTPAEDRPWPARHDPFSTCRSGFEVRTHRRCERVLLFHHFPREPSVGTSTLVRSTKLTYRDPRIEPGQHPVPSLLETITQTGHRRRPDGTFARRSLPPVELSYSAASLRDEVHDVDEDLLAGLPAGVSGAGAEWVDLDGEGLPGVLRRDADVWSYKRNTTHDGTLRLAAPEAVPALPVRPRRARLLDLAADGHTDLVVLEGPAAGFHEHGENGEWTPFTPFEHAPAIDWDQPGLRFVDLTGDGHADVLLTDEEVLTWWPSLGEAGFAAPVRSPCEQDEQRGPRVLFSDGTDLVLLADMNGDGLADVVRVRSKEVVYWPSLGHGRFGGRVTMDHPPWLGDPSDLNPARIFLGDIDGSGTADLLRLTAEGVVVHFNASGNGWTDGYALESAPLAHPLHSVDVEDLLGNGTACLVYSTPIPDDARSGLRYIDLLGGVKPHLLTRIRSNAGAETRISYAPSTRFYLQDRAASRPWFTRLPFPVQVVDRVEVDDLVSGNRLASRYAYHHGRFADREFRGFALVEQWDAEEGAAVAGAPPTLTRTWFHTGAAADANRVSQLLAGEHWSEPGTELALPDTVLPDRIWLPDGTRLAHRLTEEEVRDAYRALTGSTLRREIFALDDTPLADRPYSVIESNYTLELFQPRSGNSPAVVFAHPRETLIASYDRDPTDLRVEHTVTVEADRFGNLLRSAALHYGRRVVEDEPLFTAEDRRVQRRGLATCTEHVFTVAAEAADAYRAPLPAEVRAFELLHAVPDPGPGGTHPLTFHEVEDALTKAADGAHEIPFEDPLGAGAIPGHPWRRLIEHQRTLYRRNDLSGPLPLKNLETRAVPFRRYRLAFTPGLIDGVYRRDVGGVEEDLTKGLPVVLAEGGYVLSDDEKAAGRFPAADPDGYWWIPSNQVLLAPAPNDLPVQELAFAQRHFFLPHRFVDPFGNRTAVTYDDYQLLIVDTEDALGNRVSVGERAASGALLSNGNDYRTLMPRLVTDVNRNRAEVAYDALGMVSGAAVMGKRGAAAGDSLAGFEPDLTEAAIEAHAADPLAAEHKLLGRATSRIVYDLRAFIRTRDQAQPQPPATCALVRETHDADLAPGEVTRVQHTISYRDGFGRPVQEKSRAEPGPLLPGGADVDPRWVGTGWTIYDNKGNKVKEYEPFFSATSRFELARTVGVARTILRDPIGRVVATLNPNHTYEKVVLHPWRQEEWDPHDTVLISDPTSDPHVGALLGRLPAAEHTPTWHERRRDGRLGTREQAAATSAAVHRRTPTVVHLDVMGRSFLTIDANRFLRGGAIVEERYATRVRNDIQGHQREILDAKGRIVLRYHHDMIGTRLRTSTMEAGERWGINDVHGEPIRTWDSRGHTLQYTYDALRRPRDLYVQATVGGAKRLAERRVYGEGRPAPEVQNLRGRVYQVFDGAGLVTNAPYDFKGNLVRDRRQLAVEYRRELDWNAAETLETRRYDTSTSYDALDRTLTRTTPDGSVIRPTYNIAGLLERLEVDLPGTVNPIVIRAASRYDAKGREVEVVHGNNARTTYRYDPDTALLLSTRTTRGNEPLQDLTYTYDAAGNVIFVDNAAQQTVFLNNRMVEPHATYTFDSLYRLIEATGRERLGQGGTPAPTSHNDASRPPLALPSDGNLMARYTERYTYDEADALVELKHLGTDPAHPGWRRTLTRREPSQIEAAKVSNRLTSTRVGSGSPQTYGHDAHGNLVSMPHLRLLRWDHFDRLRSSAQQVVADGSTPETTHQVSGFAGRRVRKVVDRHAAVRATPVRTKERIYIGDFEVYREYGPGATVALERNTLTVADGDSAQATIETRTRGNDGSPPQLVRHRMPDRLGSTTLELDAARRVISYEEYFPYGGTAYRAARNELEAPNRMRWAGKERDEETGFVYFGVRHYAPWLGQWTGCDPGGPAGGANLYSYNRANPITNEDPDGATSLAKLLKGSGKVSGKAKKPSAGFGHSGQHKSRSPSIWEGGKRKAEDEHAASFGEQTRSIRESETSDVSAITRGDYQEQWTIRIPYDMARVKTANDLRIQRALEAARKPGAKISDELAHQMTPQGVIERMKSAREQTRLQRGKGKHEDLDAVTDEAIEADVALQFAQMHGAGKKQDYSRFSALTEKELKKALSSLDMSKAGFGAVLLLGLVAGADASAATNAKSSAPSPSEAAPGNYMDGVHQQLRLGSQVTGVLIEDSPSDALTALVGGIGMGPALADAFGRRRADLMLHGNPNMVVLHNAPYVLNTSTGQLSKIGAFDIEPVAAMGRFGNWWGGGGYFVWQQGDQYRLFK